MKQELNILIIINNIYYSIQDDIERFIAWTDERTPVSCHLTYLRSDFSDLQYKPFGVLLNGQAAYGLVGIKDKSRKANLVEKDQYDVVIFLYDIAKEWDWNTTMLGAWTYPNTIYDQEIFVESPVQATFDSINNLTRILTHEIIHTFHRMCWVNGIITRDTMDLYDEEFDIFSQTGNRARNLKELSQYWNALFFKIGRSQVLKKITKMLNEMVKTLLKLKYKTMVEKIAFAIQEYEGWYKDSRSFRNNNPGNLKYMSQRYALGKDKDGFAIFADYDKGFLALINQLKFSASGKSKVYDPDMNLIEFFQKYSPSSDNNSPVSYALFVANRTKVDPQEKIKNLFV